MQNTRREGINKFFLAYRRTFEAADIERIAGFYRFPLHYFNRGGDKALYTRDQFGDQVGKLLQLYRRMNVTQIVGTVSDVIELNPTLNLVSLSWMLLTKKGAKPEQLYTSSTRYIIGENDDGLKIDGLIAVDETAKINKILLGKKSA